MSFDAESLGIMRVLLFAMCLSATRRFRSSIQRGIRRAVSIDLQGSSVGFRRIADSSVER